MTEFSPTVVEAVLAHMNTDHEPDNLAIVRAFAEPDARTAVMIGLDSAGGRWRATVAEEQREVSIPWPQTVVERADIRRAVTTLYRDACAALGIQPRVE